MLVRLSVLGHWNRHIDDVLLYLMPLSLKFFFMPQPFSDLAFSRLGVFDMLQIFPHAFDLYLNFINFLLLPFILLLLLQLLLALTSGQFLSASAVSLLMMLDV